MARIADDPSDRLDKAGHFIEMTTITLGVMALGWCRAHAATSQVVADWHKPLDRKGASLGGWIVLLRGAGSALASDPNDPLARAVRLAIGNVLPQLDKFVRIRNQYAHGGKPRVRVEVESAEREMTELASVVLDTVQPLTNIRLGVVRKCGKPARSRHYELHLDVLTGYAELFSAQRLASSRSYDPGTVLAFSADNLQFAVDLAPYCIFYSCPVCSRDELFYLTKCKRSRSDHFSFTTGHELRLKGNAVAQAPPPLAGQPMQSLGSRRSVTAHGWRASWADLSPRHRRVAARAADTGS